MDKVENQTLFDKNALWVSVLHSIKEQIPEANFNTWFQDTHITKIIERCVVVGVPNDFVKNWLKQKYSLIIINLLKNQNKDIRELKFIVSKKKIILNQNTFIIKNTQKKTISQNIETGSIFEGLSVDEERNLNPKYTFGSFIVAPYNELVDAAAKAVVRRPGVSYNPFFVYGNTGVGKTHILQAIGNKVAALYPNLKVYYLTSEQFANEYYEAIQTAKMSIFKERYRHYDLLIIDDIQFFNDGKKKTMEELFYLFNALYDKNKQIIFSADQHPNELTGLEDRLKSRFSSGMILEIPPLDPESRQIILQSKLKEAGIDLSYSINKEGPEIIEYAIKNISGGVREIEGFIKTMRMYKEMYKKETTLFMVRKVIETNIKSKTINYKDVVKKVCSYYDIDKELVVKKTRKKEVVLARQVIMYILREYLNYPYSSIGSKLGGKDHTTAIHSVEKIKKNIIDNNLLKTSVEKIKSSLNL